MTPPAIHASVYTPTDSSCAFCLRAIRRTDNLLLSELSLLRVYRRLSIMRLIALIYAKLYARARPVDVHYKSRLNYSIISGGE